MFKIGIDKRGQILYFTIMQHNKINCCETCQVYWTCETKWYRGEKGEENICCPVCNYYKICMDKINKEKEAKEK